MLQRKAMDRRKITSSDISSYYFIFGGGIAGKENERQGEQVEGS